MKIATCVPHYGDVKAKFAVSLANLIAATSGHEIKAFFEPGLLPLNRNKLAALALDWDADLLLWIDADMTFPPDALERLIARNLAFVGANYPRRGGGLPTASIAGQAGNIPVHTDREKAELGKIEEVDNIGLGLALMEASAVRELREAARRERLPLFHLELMPTGEYLGEDHFFFARARRLGFKVYVDHAVSRGVGHIGDVISTNAGSADADTVLPAPRAK